MISMLLLPNHLLDRIILAHHPRSSGACGGRWRFFIVLFGWLLLSPLVAFGQSGQLAVGSADSYLLSPVFEYFIDASGQQSINEIRRDDRQQRFRPISENPSGANFGVTSAGVWLRVELRAQPGAPKDWLFELANPLMDRVDLYVLGPDGMTHQTGGDLIPFDQRRISHRNHVFRLSLNPAAPTTLYLRVSSRGTVVTTARLWRPAALWQQDHVTYSSFSLYFGLMLGLSLYNFLLFLSIRDRVYLIYVAFVVSVALYQASLSGLGAQFLWPDSPWWGAHSPPVCAALSSCFALLFARDFLHSPVRMPRLNTLMLFLVAAALLTVMTSLFLPFELPVKLAVALAAATIATVLAAGLVSLRQGSPEAKYFLIAWGALMAGATVLVLYINGVLTGGSHILYSFLVGSALEMILLSFALAARINVARAEKEQAEARSVAEHAMVEALEQSQQRSRAVIEHVGEGMMVAQDERPVFVNTRAAEILGLTKEALLADGFLNRVHADDRAMVVDRVRRRQAGLDVARRCELRAVLPDGTVKWLEVGDAIVPWDGGAGTLTFFTDLTERKQAEDQTRSALERQKQLNDLRGRFVTMTSHEFRTPLATILSSAELLKYYDDRLPPAEKEQLIGSIQAGVRRITGMLEKVLQIGKADAKMLDFHPARIDLQALLESVMEGAQRQFPTTSCELVADFSIPSPSQLHGRFDPTLLRHIFDNLLSNAVKYSPAGGEVRFKVFPDGEAMVFEVSDQGIGIPDGEIADLFESFHRASNVGDIQGTGLGLAIVKSSVEAHGGLIEVANRPNGGTCFTVRI